MVGLRCRIFGLPRRCDRTRAFRSAGKRSQSVRQIVTGQRWDAAMWGSVFSEWLSLIFRWLHVVAAIGWIGSSFYFIHLDLSLKPSGELPEGVQGEAWQVHGGGFYRIVKYLVAPAQLPDE